MKPAAVRIIFMLSLTLFILSVIIMPFQKTGTKEFWVGLAALVLNASFASFLAWYIKKTGKAGGDGSRPDNNDDADRKK